MKDEFCGVDDRKTWNFLLPAGSDSSAESDAAGLTSLPSVIMGDEAAFGVAKTSPSAR